MPLPSGRRLSLLDPFDPRQEPGKAPRVYPLHLMDQGDWFAVDNCMPKRAAAIRSAVVNFRRSCPDRRFAVRYLHELGPATVVCARVA
jgi:hypothetical protein